MTAVEKYEFSNALRTV